MTGHYSERYRLRFLQVYTLLWGRTSPGQCERHLVCSLGHGCTPTVISQTKDGAMSDATLVNRYRRTRARRGCGIVAKARALWKLSQFCEQFSSMGQRQQLQCLGTWAFILNVVFIKSMFLPCLLWLAEGNAIQRIHKNHRQDRQFSNGLLNLFWKEINGIRVIGLL